MANLCFIYWIDADLYAMRQTAERSLKIAMDRRMPETKEIADKLFISTTTLKGHLQNIYGKLSVRKRREAIEKEMDLGILARRRFE